jgi:hypothetical protein
VRITSSSAPSQSGNVPFNSVHRRALHHTPRT